MVRYTTTALTSMAFNIRNGLLKWYRIYLRKISWRGVICPFNGSTSGIKDDDTTNEEADNFQFQNREILIYSLGAYKKTLVISTTYAIEL